LVQQRKNQSCQSKNKSCLISSALDKKHSELLTYEQTLYQRFKDVKNKVSKKLSQSLWKPYFNARFLKSHKRLSFRPIAE
jgi:hypothetical protein